MKHKNKFLLTASTLLLSAVTQAQIKIKDLDELSEGTKKAGDTVQEIAIYLIGGVLAIALVGCVYMVSTNHPKGREALIAVIVGIVIYILAITVVF